MRTVLVVLVAAAVAVSLGAAASLGARSATVNVFDTRIQPAAVSVALGGTVTWKNVGKQPHVVVSPSGTFRPLALRPGQSKQVEFKKRACERYTVDGRFQGTVSVGGAPCAAGGGNGSTGLSEKIIRYDITVIAYVHTVKSYTCPPTNPECTGKTDLELSWTGKWRAQKIKVQTTSDFAGFATTEASRKQGMIRGKLVWSGRRGRPTAAVAMAPLST